MTRRRTPRSRPVLTPTARLLNRLADIVIVLFLAVVLIRIVTGLTPPAHGLDGKPDAPFGTRVEDRP